MMYAIRYRGGHSTLIEVTAHELRKEVEDALNLPPNVIGSVRPVSARFAHDFVRRGGCHETGLWIDNGRIRKALPQS